MKYKLLILVPLLAFSAFTLAQGVQYQLLQPLPNLQSAGGENPFGDYVAGLIPFILSLAAVLATIMIIWGGIEYAVSEAVDAKSDAKDRITQAILGLLLALMSYLILNTINPNLVNLNFQILPLP